MGTNMMRSIYSLTQLQKIRVGLDAKLENLFKVREGSTGEGKLETLNPSVVDVLMSEFSVALYQAANTTEQLNDMNNVAAEVREIIGSRQVNGRKKSTRVFQEILTKHDFNVNSKPIQDWVMRWSNEFNLNSIKFNISWSIEDFNKLGHIRGVDSGRSCYAIGDCWGMAPVILAAGFFYEVPTFVIFLKNTEEKIIGRCWGFYEEASNRFYVSNGYYASGGVQTIRAFVRAIESSVGYALGFKNVGGMCIEWPVYVNGDVTLLYNIAEVTAGDFTLPSYTHYDCVECGDESEENNGYTSAFCEDCGGSNSRINCDRCGNRHYLNDMQSCPDCGDHYCDRCYDVTHPECSTCWSHPCPQTEVTTEVRCMRWNTIQSDTVCENCLTKMAEMCDNCNNYYRTDVGEGVCPTERCKELAVEKEEELEIV